MTMYLIVQQEHVAEGFEGIVPRLYQVCLGMGYLELPQVEVPHNKLVPTLLNTKNVYILDCLSDVFVWLVKYFRSDLPYFHFTNC
jgi:hypothetical protein